MPSQAAEGMINTNEDGPVRQQQHSLVIYRHAPKPIVVEAESFQTLVQSLTSGKRKRKTVTLKEDVENIKAREDSSSEQREGKVQIQTLLDYLDRLDQECRPPSRASGNRGFFATAGLVKGIKMEDGLQQSDDSPDSPRTPLTTSAIEDEPQEATSRDCWLAKSSTPFCDLPKLVCSEWTGCLSPRSHQVVMCAKRTARWAASGDYSGSGPRKISMEKIADIDYDSSEADETGSPIDVVFYKGGEITIVGKS